MPRAVLPPPPVTPGVIANQPVGVAVLVIGVVGWIALGLIVWFLERRGGRPAP
jgi:hypothetical protein